MYQKNYRKDESLPAAPDIIYKKEWDKRGKWIGFLLPQKCEDLSTLKNCVKILKIKTSLQYRNCYKQYPQLPSHPERKFKNEWIDWYDLFGVIKFYTYDESINIIHSQNIT